MVYGLGFRVKGVGCPGVGPTESESPAAPCGARAPTGPVPRASHAAWCARGARALHAVRCVLCTLGCMLHVACCRTHFACCMLHAECMLHVGCMLRAA